MRMKILALCAVLFVACSALHFVEPAAAANHKGHKLVDSGTKYGTTMAGHGFKLTWKTYQYKNKKGKLSNNFVKVIMSVYFKENRKYVKNYDFITTITKINKSTVDVREIIPDGAFFDHYYTTRLTAAQYYWRIYRSQLRPL